MSSMAYRAAVLCALLVPALVSAAAGQTCSPDSTTLCLNQGRFAVSMHWAAPDGGSGAATAVPLTADTGLFWFFEDTNVEAVVKVLDGCGLNGNFWVFAAGLTNLRAEMTVVDTATGVTRVYTNPQGTAFAPIQDTGSFPVCGVSPSPRPSADRVEAPRPRQGVTGGLLLGEGRFEVVARWRGPEGVAEATGVALTADTGYFWFFDENNVEVVLKIVDGCPFNQRHWIFAAGLTNVEVEITITDQLTGATETLFNPSDTEFVPVQRTDNSLVSTACLPRCADRPEIGDAQIELAVNEAVASVADPADADFGEMLGRIGANLGCRFLDEDGFTRAGAGFPALGDRLEDRLRAKLTDVDYDPDVSYCGRGDSSNSWLVMPMGDTCINRRCHAHDLCYQRECVGFGCIFAPQNLQAYTCDVPLIDGCGGECGALSVPERIVCAIIPAIQTTQLVNPTCDGPACADGESCNGEIGECENCDDLGGDADNDGICDDDDPCVDRDVDGICDDQDCCVGHPSTCQRYEKVEFLAGGQLWPQHDEFTVERWQGDIADPHQDPSYTEDIPGLCNFSELGYPGSKLGQTCDGTWRTRHDESERLAFEFDEPDGPRYRAKQISTVRYEPGRVIFEVRRVYESLGPYHWPYDPPDYWRQRIFVEDEDYCRIVYDLSTGTASLERKIDVLQATEVHSPRGVVRHYFSDEGSYSSAWDIELRSSGPRSSESCLCEPFPY